MDAVVVGQDPLQGSSDCVEEKRCGSKAEGEALIHIEGSFPVDPEKVTVLWPNRAEPEGILQVYLSHKGAWA